jgi:hypothetical protein
MNLPIFGTTMCDRTHITDTRLRLKPEQKLAIIKPQVLQKSLTTTFLHKMLTLSLYVSTNLIYRSSVEKIYQMTRYIFAINRICSFSWSNPLRR